MLFALTLAACGSRTTPLVDAPDAHPTPRDSGARSIDAATADGGRSSDAGVDASTRAACVLERRGDPVVVHEDARLPFDRVAAVARAGGFDLGASFDRWRTDLFGATRIVRAHTTGGAISLVLLTAPLAGPASLGARGDDLGVCWSTRSDEVRVDLFGGELYTARPGGPRFTEMELGPCLATTGTDDHWFAAFVAGAARTTVFVGVHDVVTGTARQMVVHNGEREVAEVGAALVGDELVLAPPPASTGVLDLLFLHPVRTAREAPVRDLRPGGAAPAVAPWPWIPRAVALAAYGRSGQLELRVVGASGEEHLRRELGFSMHADVQPALVATQAGAVVAWLSYGDADPTAGSLIVQQVTPSGDATAEPILVPTIRDESLRLGSVAIAVLEGSSGPTVVVHWTDTEHPRAGRTLAMLLTCDPD